MAKSASFGFTNTSWLKINSNYDMIGAKESDKCALSNKTCALDQEERISFMSSNTSSTTVSQGVVYPSAVKASSRASVLLEEVLRETDSGDATYVQDYPIRVTVTIQGVKNAYLDDTLLSGLVARAKMAGDAIGWNALLRGAVVPTSDEAQPA